MELQLVCAICGATLEATMVPPGKVEVEPCEECALRNESVPVGPDADEARSLRVVAWGQRG